MNSIKDISLLFFLTLFVLIYWLFTSCCHNYFYDNAISKISPIMNIWIWLAFADSEIYTFTGSVEYTFADSVIYTFTESVEYTFADSVIYTFTGSVEYTFADSVLYTFTETINGVYYCWKCNYTFTENAGYTFADRVDSIFFWQHRVHFFSIKAYFSMLYVL